MIEGLRILLAMLGVLIAAKITLPHSLRWLSGYLTLMTLAVIIALIIMAARV